MVAVSWAYIPQRKKSQALPTSIDGVPLSQKDAELLRDLKRKRYEVLEQLAEAHQDKPQALRLIKEAMRTHGSLKKRKA